MVFGKDALQLSLERYSGSGLTSGTHLRRCNLEVS